jgi:O-antigen ligase
MTFNLSIPLTNAKINNLTFVLMVLVTLINFAFSGYKLQPFRKQLFWFTCIYFVYLISFFQTENVALGLTDLFERKVGLLALPIVLYLSPGYSAKQIRTILLTFVFSCTLTAIFCLIVATYSYSFKGVDIFTYHNLSLIAGQHAIYLAMFYCFSLIILLYLARYEEWTWSLSQRLYIASAIVFCFSIFLLAARLHIFLFVAGAGGYIFVLLKRKYNLLIGVTISLCACFALAAAMLTFSQKNRERFKQLVNYKGQYGVYGEWGEQQVRPLIWSCAFDLIKARPILGYGAGDTQTELIDCYTKNNYGTVTHFQGVKLNAHNQYLETTLTTGVIGLLTLIACYVSGLVNAILTRNYLYGSLVLLFAISCLSESFFERQNGVVFFSFFNAFLFFYNAEKLRPRTGLREQTDHVNGELA